jgi:hypothetical protein
MLRAPGNTVHLREQRVSVVNISLVIPEMAMGVSFPFSAEILNLDLIVCPKHALPRAWAFAAAKTQRRC